ncbi:MAG TPA: hypothetical protein VG056_05680, partial [Pirellulales bacterium]|nr:hypothetical protein [Pirellulales bacterium]
MDDLPTSDGTRQILAINGGSSSIKFALFAAAADEKAEPRRTLSGTIERIGQPGTALVISGNGRTPLRREVAAANHEEAAERLIEALHEPLESGPLVGIGH